MEQKSTYIDITKAIENAYLKQLQFKTYSNDIQQILIKTNPQTAIDNTVKEFSFK